MRTLRDFMTPAFWVICSTASQGRSRRWSRARARSGVRAGSEARARSSGVDTIDRAEASGVISGWDGSGLMVTDSDSTAGQDHQHQKARSTAKVKASGQESRSAQSEFKIKINNKVKGDEKECSSYILRARLKAPSTGSTISGCTCTPGSSQRT